MKNRTRNTLYIIVFFVTILYTFIFDRQNFFYSEIDTLKDIVFLSFSKICTGVYIVIILKVILKLHCMVKEKDYFLPILVIVYLCAEIVLCYILYRLGYIGSTMHGDMTTILENASHYKFCVYQGWYSSFVYGIAMNMMPASILLVGIVVIQLTLISIVILRICYVLRKQCNKVIALSAFVIFMLPPYIVFGQFTMRESWFMFFLSLLVVEIFNLHKMEVEFVSYKYLFYISAVIVSTALLRPEAIYLIPLYILLFLSNSIKKLVIKKRVYIILCICIFTVLAEIPNGQRNEAKSTPFMNPLANMIVDSDFEWDNEERDREAIEKIISIDWLKESASYSTSTVLLGAGEKWNKQFTSDEYKEFLKTYFKLVKKNPLLFIKVRFMTFKSSNEETAYLGWAWGSAQIGEIIGSDLMFIRVIIRLLYNSFIPVIVMWLVFLMIRKWVAFVMGITVTGEVGMLYLLVTNNEYMFYVQYMLATLVTSLIFVSIVFGRKNDV